MVKAKAIKVPVTERALLQRINRKLAKDDELVRKNRGFYDQGRGPHFNELGAFYMIDVSRNAVMATDVDLEELGREVKALAPWETLALEESK